MPRIVPAACPNCGAALKLDAEQQMVTCTYCGTSSLIQHEGRDPVPRQDEHVILVRAQRAPTMPAVRALIAGAIAFFALSGAVFIFLRSERPAPVPGPGPAPTALVPVPLPEPAENLSFSGRRPMLADANGDGASDVIALVSSSNAGKTENFYAVFDGNSGRRLWQTEDLGSNSYDSVVGIWLGHLVVGLADGKVRAYALSNGARRFETQLPERVQFFCDALWAAGVRASLADGKLLDVDLSKGATRAAPAKAECHPIPSDQNAKSDVEKHVFPDEDLPRELESYACGNITVKGTYNYLFADQCAKKLGAEAFGEFHPASIVKLDSSWAILGRKEPGSAVPMLGVVQGGKLAWSVVVPSKEPLAQTSGKPRYAGIGKTRIVIAYKPPGPRQVLVTAFDFARGTRLYETDVGGEPIRALSVSNDRVLVLGSSDIVVLAADTGRVLFSVGRK